MRFKNIKFMKMEHYFILVLYFTTPVVLSLNQQHAPKMQKSSSTEFLEFTEGQDIRLRAFEKEQFGGRQFSQVFNEGYFIRWVYIPQNSTTKGFSCTLTVTAPPPINRQTNQTRCRDTNAKIDNQSAELRIPSSTVHGTQGIYKYQLLNFAITLDGNTAINGEKSVSIIKRDLAAEEASFWSWTLNILLIVCAILVPLLLIIVVFLWCRSKRSPKKLSAKDISGPQDISAPHRGFPDGKNRDSSMNSSSQNKFVNSRDDDMHITVNANNSNNEDDMPLLTPTLKDSAIGSGSNPVGAGGAAMTSMVPDAAVEKASKLIQQSKRQDDRTTKLLAQVDNFVSDRESSSIAMGTSATSNPPSLVNQHQQIINGNLGNLSPDSFNFNNQMYGGMANGGSNDDDIRRGIDDDVAQSLIAANNTLTKAMSTTNSSYNKFNTHSSHPTGNSRHSSNTTTSVSRQLPSYHEAINKRNNPYSTLPKNNKIHSPQTIATQPPPSSQHQQYKASTLTRNNKQQQSDKSTKLVAPDQPIHVQIENDNMDYC